MLDLDTVPTGVSPTGDDNIIVELESTIVTCGIRSSG